MERGCTRSRPSRADAALHQWVPEVIEGDYGASFKTSLALKDINLILDFANEEHYAARLRRSSHRCTATR